MRGVGAGDVDGADANAQTQASKVSPAPAHAHQAAHRRPMQLTYAWAQTSVFTGRSSATSTSHQPLLFTQKKHEQYLSIGTTPAPTHQSSRSLLIARNCASNPSVRALQYGAESDGSCGAMLPFMIANLEGRRTEVKFGRWRRQGGRGARGGI